MARKATKKAVKKAAKPSDDPVKVECLGESVWAGGAGFLSKGDVAVVSAPRVHELLADKLVKEIP